MAGWELIPGASRGERESAGQVNCFHYVGPPMNKPLAAPASAWWPSCSGSVTEHVHYRLELSAKDGRECRDGSRPDLLATVVCSWNRRGAKLWMLFLPGPPGEVSVRLTGAPAQKVPWCSPWWTAKGMQSLRQGGRETCRVTGKGCIATGEFRPVRHTGEVVEEVDTILQGSLLI